MKYDENNTETEKTLLKYLTGGEAFIYKVIRENPSGVLLEEICCIKPGKMIVNSGKTKTCHIFPSDAGTRYKKLKIEEVNKLIDILSNALKKVGF